MLAAEGECPPEERHPLVVPGGGERRPEGHHRVGHLLQHAQPLHRSQGLVGDGHRPLVLPGQHQRAREIHAHPGEVRIRGEIRVGVDMTREHLHHRLGPSRLVADPTDERQRPVGEGLVPQRPCHLPERIDVPVGGVDVVDGEGRQRRHLTEVGLHRRRHHRQRRLHQGEDLLVGV